MLTLLTIIYFTAEDPEGALLQYRSRRRGFHYYAQGLVSGVFFSPALTCMHISAVDPNSLFWDPDPEMCPTLDHDPRIVTDTPTVRQYAERH